MEHLPLTSDAIQTIYLTSIKEKERKEREEREERWRIAQEEKDKKDKKEKEEQLQFIDDQVRVIYQTIYSELTKGINNKKYHHLCNHSRYRCTYWECFDNHMHKHEIITSEIIEKLKQKFPDSKIFCAWVGYNTDSNQVEYDNYDDLNDDIVKRIPKLEDRHNYEYGGYDRGESNEEYEERKENFINMFLKIRCIIIDWS